MSQDKNMTYEQAVKRLEEIAGLMEDGALTLDESMKLFEESTSLSAFCYEKLKAFKQQITKVTENGEEAVDDE